MESAVVMTSGYVITLDDLPPSIRESDAARSIVIPVGSTMSDAEKEVILQTLSAQNGNKSRTAEVLGIGRKTLHRKLDEYGLEAGIGVQDGEETDADGDSRS